MAKDPVCGMNVSEDGTLLCVREGQTFHFCSALCKELFESQPEKYVGDAKTQAFLGESRRRVAYFSMEIGLDPKIPTYSGGLGILAGDTLKSCADLRVPLIGVTLLYERGYFDQHLDEYGNQHEQSVQWSPQHLLARLAEKIEVTICGRTVAVGAWHYDIPGAAGHFILRRAVRPCTG